MKPTAFVPPAPVRMPATVPALPLEEPPPGTSASSPAEAPGNAKPASSLRGVGAAAAGASAAAAVLPLADAVVHGRMTHDGLRNAARKAAGGVALAAAGAYAEEAAAKALERVGGKAVEQAATSIGADGALAARAASRLGGAGIAGAAINLGLSAYQNREGLARGDSHAIGKVAGDVVVASSAALAGAMAGAEAGALLGSIVPGAGTVIGLGVGAAAGFIGGFATDQLLRSARLDSAVGDNVANALDAIEHR